MYPENSRAISKKTNKNKTPQIMLGYKKITKLCIKKSKKKREEWSKTRYTKERERMEGIEKWGLLISPHLRNTPETDDIILNLQKEELGKSYK